MAVRSSWTNDSGRADGKASYLFLLVSALVAGFWLVYGLDRGATAHHDSASYLELADAVERGSLITSIRTLGYPLFIVMCRRIAAAVGADPMRLLVATQVALLSGMGTWMLCETGRRISGSVAVGVCAGALLALDIDVQHFGAAVMTEALASALSIAALWCRIRDGSWRRGAWVLAALGVTRPNLFVLPLVFGIVDLAHTRRPSEALFAVVPSLVLGGACLLSSVLSGTDPLAPQRHFAPLHSFGKIYEADLWRVLPPGPERQEIENSRHADLDPYLAADSFRRAFGHGHLMVTARKVIRADPLGYMRACAAILPLEFRQMAYWPGGTALSDRRPGWSDRWAWLLKWRRVYHAILYSPLGFVAFLVLCLGAWSNGLGWSDATPAVRYVLLPWIATLMVSIATLSLGSEGVARLALGVRPVNALLWALAIVGALRPRPPARY